MPPKKDAQPEDSRPLEEKIQEYMKDSNRPFNVTDIHARFKDASKAAVTKTLTSLVEKGFLISKVYAKSPIYVFKQSDDTACDPEISKNMESEAQRLEKSCRSLTEELQRLQSQLTTIEASPQTDTIPEKIQEQLTELSTLEETHNKLTSEQQKENMDESERAEIEKDWEQVRGIWRARRQLGQEMLDMITSPFEKKEDADKWVESIGVEKVSGELEMMEAELRKAGQTDKRRRVKV